MTTLIVRGSPNQDWESVVCRVRVLHPEFGYVGTTSFFRSFLVFIVFGLVAGVISFAIFNQEPERNAMDAMALAPPEALTDPTTALLTTRRADVMPVQKAEEESKQALVPCQEIGGEMHNGKCVPVRVVRVRPLRAANERPLIASVPIGHSDDPVMLASPSQSVGVSSLPAVSQKEPNAPAPMDTAVAETTPADMAPAAELINPIPGQTPTAKKSRPGIHRAQYKSVSRRHNDYSYRSSAYLQAGYARVW